VGRERVEPKEILDTDRLWAVFNKGYLIHLSLMGFPAGDLRNTKVDNLDFITADLTGDHPEDSDEFSEIEAMLLKETCSFLDTGKSYAIGFLFFYPVSTNGICGGSSDPARYHYYLQRNCVPYR
jgi:hypothetical protein